ncbi:MAG: hypothetical protein IJ043_05805 [Clostridia bacterium]|nr:hypothetical protein [Clostridia bacterium]
MDQQLKECLENQKMNYILPFLWLHGESHEELREEILAIKQSGCLSFCAESRPYPDFCRAQWWEDFGFILKTAKELDMNVWLLDDKKFPTGFANGGTLKHPELRKKTILCEKVDVQGPQQDVALIYDYYCRHGEKLLAAVAYKRTGKGVDCAGEPIDLTPTAEDGLVRFDIPDGMWRVFFLLESQEPVSGRPDHIDMLNPASTELMISEIYQPQYEHFAEYFGNTFRGFFSDEPGFLNSTGSYYGKLGRSTPYPWRADLPALMGEKLGKAEAEVLLLLPALWANVNDVSALRVAYMDTVTALYAQNFTEKLGGWCRAHGVEYIGHTIEDMGSCSRMGHSAGHYFRCLDAQDMAGIDVVLHQIMPGQNEMPHTARIFDRIADPTFFVYALAKLGSSHAHLNPNMKNRAMCEIFGAYGYAEGLPFMKKLADHMLASGINRYVPHAFSPKYPDPDCPPHFYSKGNNPQFEGFGELIRYMQRVIHLFEGSIHQAPIALYYNAECEWAGDETDTYFSVAKVLTQNQLDFDFVSEDYLAAAEFKDQKLCINQEEYSLLVLPGCRYVTPRMRKFLQKMEAEYVPFYFRGTAPAGFESHLETVLPCQLRLTVPSPHLRYYHAARDGKDIYMFKNDGDTPIDTVIELLPEGAVTVYDAWNNRVFRKEDRRLTLDGGESIIWILGEKTEGLPEYLHPMTLQGQDAVLLWEITAGEQSYSASPLFNITGKGGQTRFSGKITYRTEAEIPAGTKMLDLGTVGETAALTLNGIPCGSRIAPPYAFDISEAIKPGKNTIEIEVVNNPAYYERDPFSIFMKLPPSGILGPTKYLK